MCIRDRTLTLACPKPEVPLEDCQREYSRVTRSTSSQRPSYTEPSPFSPSCTVQRPGFSLGSISGYLSCFNIAVCAPSLASNGKTTCQTKKSSRKPAYPAKSPSCFRCSSAGLDMTRGWKTLACPKMSSSASSKKESSWRSEKALQRPAEETACTGGNQPAIMVAGGLRTTQFTLVSEERHS